jgi:hypothetical protein
MKSKRIDRRIRSERNHEHEQYTKYPNMAKTRVKTRIFAHYKHLKKETQTQGISKSSRL